MTEYKEIHGDVVNLSELEFYAARENFCPMLNLYTGSEMTDGEEHYFEVSEITAHNCLDCKEWERSVEIRLTRRDYDKLTQYMRWEGEDEGYEINLVNGLISQGFEPEKAREIVDKHYDCGCATVMRWKPVGFSHWDGDFAVLTYDRVCPHMFYKVEREHDDEMGRDIPIFTRVHEEPQGRV